MTETETKNPPSPPSPLISPPHTHTGTHTHTRQQHTRRGERLMANQPAPHRPIAVSCLSSHVRTAHPLCPLRESLAVCSPIQPRGAVFQTYACHPLLSSHARLHPHAPQSIKEHDPHQSHHYHASLPHSPSPPLSVSSTRQRGMVTRTSVGALHGTPTPQPLLCIPQNTPPDSPQQLPAGRLLHPYHHPQQLPLGARREASITHRCYHS